MGKYDESGIGSRRTKGTIIDLRNWNSVFNYEHYVFYEGEESKQWNRQNSRLDSHISSTLAKSDSVDNFDKISTAKIKNQL